MIETSSARGTIWSFFLFKTKMARAKGWINQIDYINVFFLRISEFPWSSCEGSWIYLNKEVHGTCLFRYLFAFSRAARSHKKHMFVLWGLGKQKKDLGANPEKENTRKNPWTVDPNSFQASEIFFDWEDKVSMKGSTPRNRRKLEWTQVKSDCRNT